MMGNGGGMSVFFMAHVMPSVCVWRLWHHRVVSGTRYAIGLCLAFVAPSCCQWHTLCRLVQVVFGGGGGGSVSSGFVSPPSTFSSTSMMFSSCVVGVGSSAAGDLTGGLANAFGTARAEMKGAGNMCPLSIPSILRPGTGPSTCCAHTVMLA